MFHVFNPFIYRIKSASPHTHHSSDQDYEIMQEAAALGKIVAPTPQKT